MFAAIPILIATPLTLERGIFEAVSAFTTTGASALPRLVDVPAEHHLVARAAAMGRRAADAGQRDRHPVADLRRGGLRVARLGNRRRHGRRAQTIELCPARHPAAVWRADGACLVLLLFARIPAFDALCLALSTVSTGGFMPRDGTIALYGSVMAELVLSVFMFLGAVSIFWTHTCSAGASARRRRAVSRFTSPG